MIASSEHCFGLHDGFLPALALTIAKRHGAWHTNYREPGTGRKRGWFTCVNCGHPFDDAVAKAVIADLDRELPDWREGRR